MDGAADVAEKPTVTPHRELSKPGPAGSAPAHRLTQEVGGATGGVGPALAQPGHQHFITGAGGMAGSGWIAASAGIAVVASALLGQSSRSRRW